MPGHASGQPVPLRAVVGVVCVRVREHAEEHLARHVELGEPEDESHQVQRGSGPRVRFLTVATEMAGSVDLVVARRPVQGLLAALEQEVGNKHDQAR